MKKNAFLKTLFVLTTLLYGIFFGGAFYEQIVLNTIWPASPPGSFQLMTDHIIPSLEAHNFYLLTPIVWLLSLVGALMIVKRRTRSRNWAMASLIAMTLLVIWTFAYFIPVLMELFPETGGAAYDEADAALARAWYGWNWGRLALAFIAFYAMLRATMEFRSEQSA